MFVQGYSQLHYVSEKLLLLLLLLLLLVLLLLLLLLLFFILLSLLLLLLSLLLLLAVVSVLHTGGPYFLFTFNWLFQSLCLALLSHATVVPVCMCVTHHLPFYWFWNLLPFLFHFPSRRTI